MELLKQLEYQIWAENKLFSQIEEKMKKGLWEKIDPELNKSFKNIYFHKAEVMWSWIEILDNKFPSETFPDNNKSYQETKEWMNELFNKIKKILKETKNEELKLKLPWLDQPYQVSRDEVLFNLLNHNTYHRGQIAILMKRILGIENVVETDYNPYLYEKLRI